MLWGFRELVHVNYPSSDQKPRQICMHTFICSITLFKIDLLTNINVRMLSVLANASLQASMQNSPPTNIRKSHIEFHTVAIWMRFYTSFAQNP
jgi:hypothetical protein